MRLTRAESRERNRRALLDAALRIVARDGHAARLEDIAAEADLTTGAVYSLFGSKKGLLIAVAADHLGPEYDAIERAAPAGLDLEQTVDVLARHFRRTCDAPDALQALSLQVSLLDTAVRDPELGAQLAASVRAQERRLVALLTGRSHQEATVAPEQAERLATALRALLVGLSQGVVSGLAPDADDDFFADAARALIAGPSLLEQSSGPSSAERGHR